MEIINETKNMIGQFSAKIGQSVYQRSIVINIYIYIYIRQKL